VDTDLTPEEREQVLKAAQGLTLMEAENVFAKSLVEKRAFDVDVILTEKEQIIRKSGILEYYPMNEAFADVGGVVLLKDWLEKRSASFTDKAREFGLPEPKGVLLIGVQGCGKSLTAKAIGALWRLPLLRLDIGKVFAGLVGASEENMRKAIRVAESVAPCVAGDTRITLADGSEETIQNLYESEQKHLKVLAMTDDWQIQSVEVRAITRRPAPDLYTIQLQHSRLQATGNHLHPVMREGALCWVRTDALCPDDYIAIPRSIPTSRENIETTGYFNVQRFITQIGSNHPCRQERMKVWEKALPPEKPKDRTDVIPVGTRLRTARLSIGMGSQHFRSTSSSLIHRYENGLGHPNRHRLRSILDEMRAWATRRGKATDALTAFQALADSPIAWSKVVSVKPETAPEYVYDLVCAGPHNFVANGIFSHNCCLWLDELEKGLSGIQGSGSSDGGTTARVFSTFLTWLQEKTVPVFVVSTANQVEALPPELLRKGRFDEIFFIDLPSRAERADIFRIHLRKRKRDPSKYDLQKLAEATPGFSGAEIEQLVIEALYDAFDKGRDLTTEDILKAAGSAVPLSMTMREKIAYLREWAKTRARPASNQPVESFEEQAEVFFRVRMEAQTDGSQPAEDESKKRRRTTRKKTDDSAGETP
jgi:ATP-dependent 26S proteasome regulatory subunit